jgi:Pyruvate/2-oxoacid:ferredoxin oxidoreductase gamma subunit
MLGAFIKKSNVVSINTMVDVLKTATGSKASLFTVNKKALLAGYDMIL